MRESNGWVLVQRGFWMVEREKRVKWPSSDRGRTAENSSFSSYQLLLERASFCAFNFSLFDSPLLFSRRKAKKRMYFSSIHCAVVMATIVLDNLLPLRTCSPLYQAILFLSSTNLFPDSSLVMRVMYEHWRSMPLISKICIDWQDQINLSFVEKQVFPWKWPSQNPFRRFSNLILI